MFRVELFRSNALTESKTNAGEMPVMSRKNTGEKPVMVWRKFGDSLEKMYDYELIDTQKRIMNLLRSNKQLSVVKIAEQLDLNSRSIERNIKKLKEYGLLIRHGSPKSGYWEVKEYEKNDD